MVKEKVNSHFACFIVILIKTKLVNYRIYSAVS